MKQNIVVLEGVPASGKTTLARILRERYGYTIVNESRGTYAHHESQRDVFDETLGKYKTAATAGGITIIDRGYPSMLNWDYCCSELGQESHYVEKQHWVQQAIREGALYEPDLYVWLKIPPELSFRRRPRVAHGDDIWSTIRGVEASARYYHSFFKMSGALSIDACQSVETVVGIVRSLIDA